MKVIVTGSFDPITKGHLEIIKYASELYEEVYVVALINPKKEYMFTMEQKRQLMKRAVEGFENVFVDSYDGLTADYMHEKGISKIIRGVRNEQDLAYEMDLAQKMKEVDVSFETEIIRCDSKLADISSTQTKNAILNGEKYDDMVPSSTKELIEKYVREK